MKPYILVIGSSNTDMVVKADRLPAPGETILGGTFLMTAGGKGANQAVAAARLGGDVVFIVKVGDDIFGRQAIQSFEEEGIDTNYAITDPVNPSGVALITVDAKAGHQIKNASLILMQLEIPLETVEYVAEIAAQNNVKLILNPAPACALPDELLSKVSIITPNQKETEMLTGVKIVDKESAQTAAELLAEKGIETVIITLGANGALVFHGNHFDWVPAPVVNAVDTTAAGDVFNGALAVAIAEGKNLEEAVLFANKAAALSVTKMGAQASAPTKRDVESF